MTRPEQNGPSEKLNRVKRGQRPSASLENKQSAAIEGLTRFNLQRDPNGPAIRLMRLSEVVGQFEQSDSQHYERTAVMQYWDRHAEEFRDTDPPVERRNVASTWLTAPHDPNEVVWCIQTGQSGVWTPLDRVAIRHARTVSDFNGQYPNCDSNPNVYPIKFTKLSWSRAMGRQTVAVSYLDTEDTHPDDYVLNVFDGPSDYLPAGTDIFCYHVVNRWYTYACCGDECSSSSRSSISVSLSSNSSSFSSSSLSSASSLSSSSQSSASSQSSSQSSNSPSSRSSVSSRSSLSSPSSLSRSESSPSSASSASSNSSSISLSMSSASSASSSLSSVSLSSISVSGSSASSFSASSGGSSQSSGYDCVTVVTSLSFNGTTCVLSYCTQQICFPKSLGITVGAENC